MSKKITFTGAGVDAGSFRLRKINRFDDSRIRSRPQGTTWPFARLSVSKGVVKFDIGLLSIHKTVSASDTTIDLSRVGYIFFRTPDEATDFGFATPRIDTLLNELRKHGFQLEESCKNNLRLAKLAIYAMVALPVLLLASMTLSTLLN